MRRRKKIDLEKIRSKLEAAAKSYFDEITGLPKEVRTDEKERTGIRVLVKDLITRDFILFSVYDPSERAMHYCSEKAVRSEVLGDYSSANSEDIKKKRFQGSVTVEIGGMIIQISVSGLKSEEDVAVAVKLLSQIFKTHPVLICNNIVRHKGKLPKVFFEPQDHYLCKFIKQYVQL